MHRPPVTLLIQYLSRWIDLHRYRFYLRRRFVNSSDLMTELERSFILMRVIRAPARSCATATHKLHWPRQSQRIFFFFFFSEEPQLNIYNSVCSCVFVCCRPLIIDLLSVSAWLCIPKDKTRKAVKDNLCYVIMKRWRKNARRILQTERSNTSLEENKKNDLRIFFIFPWHK